MHISPFIIYLWGIADTAKGSLGAACGITLFGAILLTALTAMATDMKDIKPTTAAKCWSWIRKLFSIAIAAGFIGMLTPSSKTVAMMVVIPAIANSKPVQQDLPDLYNMAVAALKEQLIPKTEKGK